VCPADQSRAAVRAVRPQRVRPRCAPHALQSPRADSTASPPQERAADTECVEVTDLDSSLVDLSPVAYLVQEEMLVGGEGRMRQRPGDALSHYGVHGGDAGGTDLRGCRGGGR